MSTYSYILKIVTILLLSIFLTLPIFAQTFSIKSKSSSFKELESTILSVHKQAIANNAEVDIQGDILEHHLDKENNDTLLFDVKGQPAKVELINDKGQLIVITAQHIIYEVSTQLVTAIDKASISWSSSYIKGHKVMYKLDGTQANCIGDETKEDSTCESNYSISDFTQ